MSAAFSDLLLENNTNSVLCYIFDGQPVEGGVAILETLAALFRDPSRAANQMLMLPRPPSLIICLAPRPPRRLAGPTQPVPSWLRPLEPHSGLHC